MLGGFVVVKDSLWARFIRDKYKCGFDTIPEINKKQSASNLLRGIVSIHESLLDGISWRVHGGNETRFWRD